MAKRVSGIRDHSPAFLLILVLSLFTLQPARAQSISANFGTGLVVMGADTGSSCSSTIAGAFRFNSGGNTLDYCNGSSWSALGIPSVSGTTCSGTASGIVRYDVTKGNLNYCNGTTWVTVGTGGSWGGSLSLSGLTAAGQIDAFDNANLGQTWTWNALTGGAGVTLGTTGTTAINGQKLLYVASSGLNVAPATTYGVSISNTHAGSSSTDVGLYATAIGGIASYAAIFNQGAVGIGTTAPQAKLDVHGELRIGSTGLVCSGTTAGAMRFNNSAKDIEFCNGSAWGQFY